MTFLSRHLVALALAVVLLALLLLSLDFMPPLHHALVYDALWRTIRPTALSQSGMVLIGPTARLYLIPSTIQTLTFGLGELASDRGPIWARADNGLPVVLTCTVQFRYEPTKLQQLWLDVETDPPTKAAPKTYYPALAVIRSLAYSALAESTTYEGPHRLMAEKARITRHMHARLVSRLGMWVDVVGVQLMRTDVPQRYEESIIQSALAKLAIVEMQRKKSRKAVEFRTMRMAARFSAVATVALAAGEAGKVKQRGLTNAAKTRQTVLAEMHAFENVTTTARVSAHDVLDYAYWQLVVGDTAQGLRERLPLHDMLIGGKAGA